MPKAGKDIGNCIYCGQVILKRWVACPQHRDLLMNDPHTASYWQSLSTRASSLGKANHIPGPAQGGGQ